MGQFEILSLSIFSVISEQCEHLARQYECSASILLASNQLSIISPNDCFSLNGETPNLVGVWSPNPQDIYLTEKLWYKASTFMEKKNP